MAHRAHTLAPISLLPSSPLGTEREAPAVSSEGPGEGTVTQVAWWPGPEPMWPGGRAQWAWRRPGGRRGRCLPQGPGTAAPPSPAAAVASAATPSPGPRGRAAGPPRAACGCRQRPGLPLRVSSGCRDQPIPLGPLPQMGHPLAPGSHCPIRPPRM